MELTDVYCYVNVILGITMILKELGISILCPAMTVLIFKTINKVKPFSQWHPFSHTVPDSLTFWFRTLLSWSSAKKQSPFCHLTVKRVECGKRWIKLDFQKISFSLKWRNSIWEVFWFCLVGRLLSLDVLFFNKPLRK